MITGPTSTFRLKSTLAHCRLRPGVRQYDVVCALAPMISIPMSCKIEDVRLDDLEALSAYHCLSAAEREDQNERLNGVWSIDWNPEQRVVAWRILAPLTQGNVRERLKFVCERLQAMSAEPFHVTNVVTSDSQGDMVSEDFFYGRSEAEIRAYRYAVDTVTAREMAVEALRLLKRMPNGLGIEAVRLVQAHFQPIFATGPTEESTEESGRPQV